MLLLPVRWISCTIWPLPAVTVIAELLGIPAELRADFKRWSDALVSGDENTSEEEYKSLFQEIQACMAISRRYLRSTASSKRPD